MKNKLFIIIVAGLSSMISLDAMDRNPEKGMQERVFLGAESGAIREAKARVRPDFVLEKKVAHKFEKYNLCVKHSIFKGLSHEKSSHCANDYFERYVKEGDDRKVAETLQKYPRFAKAHPLAISFVRIATNQSDTLDFDQKYNPNISYMEAMNIGLAFAFDGDNKQFVDNHPIEHKNLWSPTNSSSSSSREDYSNSDDF
jgi:hypothetical protein